MLRLVFGGGSFLSDCPLPAGRTHTHRESVLQPNAAPVQHCCRMCKDVHLMHASVGDMVCVWSGAMSPGLVPGAHAAIDRREPGRIQHCHMRVQCATARTACACASHTSCMHGPRVFCLRELQTSNFYGEVCLTMKPSWATGHTGRRPRRP